jgi:endonuclease YncB( thermonuclease family)
MKNQPRYTIIRGAFHIFYPDLPRSGPQPDGDTVTFKPRKQSLVEGLERFSRRPPDFNGRGMIPLRFEGIDALETHFREMRQNLRWARAARDNLLAGLGFGRVTFWQDHPNNVQTVEHNPVEGFVFANGIESNGRLLGLVYAGEAPAADGTRFRVEPDHLRLSANFRQVADGLAYAELYDTMPLPLQTALRQGLEASRTAEHGFWPHENVSATTDATIGTLGQLQELVMWPKLFRRLAGYFAAGHAGLGGFDDWVRDDPVHRDDALRLPDGEAGNIHDIYEIDGNTLKLKFDSWKLTIAPDPA